MPLANVLGVPPAPRRNLRGPAPVALRPGSCGHLLANHSSGGVALVGPLLPPSVQGLFLQVQSWYRVLNWLRKAPPGELPFMLGLQDAVCKHRPFSLIFKCLYQYFECFWKSWGDFFGQEHWEEKLLTVTRKESLTQSMLRVKSEDRRVQNCPSGCVQRSGFQPCAGTSKCRSLN